MLRFCLVSVLILSSAAVYAAGLGRTDLLWKEYLSETVRRGLPLISTDPEPGVVPFWPALVRARQEAETLEPSDDLVLLGAWIDSAEGRGAEAVEPLRQGWPQPALTRWSARLWGETLFALWEPRSEPRDWTDAWLRWQDKAYSPRSLVVGIEGLELTDRSAVVPLLTQALELYPDDRRFLVLLARHPEVHPSTAALLARDRARGGWSDRTLDGLLSRGPEARALLVDAGYPVAQLDAVQGRSYARWVSQFQANPAPGAWTWDADADGRAESQLVLDEEGLVSWSRRTTEGLWTLSLQAGKPQTLVETRLGASWTLRWEAYPLASSLEYRWGDRRLVYRFRPLTQAVPIWPAERLRGPSGLWPASLADQWLPLDPRALASAAASIETWSADQRIDTMFLVRGEVWLEIQDTNRDGVDDLFSYFRGGRLASVYSDAAGMGDASLRELYTRGELVQVQSRAADRSRNEFVLFPQEGVQLWDPHGDRRPLERLFLWEGDSHLGALVFAQDKLPWETMPAWESRP